MRELPAVLAAVALALGTPAACFQVGGRRACCAAFAGPCACVLRWARLGPPHLRCRRAGRMARPRDTSARRSRALTRAWESRALRTRGTRRPPGRPRQHARSEGHALWAGAPRARRCCFLQAEAALARQSQDQTNLMDKNV